MPSLNEAAEAMLRGVEEWRARAMRGESGIVIDPNADVRVGVPATDPQSGIGLRYFREFNIAPPISSWYEATGTVGEDPPTPARRVPPKDPTTITVEAQPVDAEYTALAKELGLSTDPLDAERFKGWVNEHGLRVYAREEVQNYLHHKYGVSPTAFTSRVVWGWRPLRDQDRRGKGEQRDERNGVVQSRVEPYRKPIPYPVLLTIKAVRDEFPSARFYVSDDMHAERIPDPFLLVQIGKEEFVIERWDEPSFRSKS